MKENDGGWNGKVSLNAQKRVKPSMSVKICNHKQPLRLDLPGIMLWWGYIDM